MAKTRRAVSYWGMPAICLKPVMPTPEMAHSIPNATYCAFIGQLA